MGLERGKLILTKKGKPRIEFTSKKGKRVMANPAWGEISQTLLDNLKERDGQEVEFELSGGQPKKIREVGGEFVPPSSQDTNTAKKQRSGHGSRDARQKDNRQLKPPDFHNPYNFVPAPPRNTNHPELGDHEPPPQDRFLPDRFTGRIRVRMEVVTPLLIPDPEKMREINDGHKVYDILVDGDGKPLVPASSIRGMLRSAYEAITNSRFGRFDENHKKRLAFRMEAREGLKLIPARVENGQIRLLTGTSNIKRDGSPDGPQYAAWLPRYSGDDKNTSNAVKYSDGSLPQHGDEVECWVKHIYHRSNRFFYWRVIAIDRVGKLRPLSQEGLKRITGWVCVTNANINRKHDERVFFVDPNKSPPGPFPVTDQHRRMWWELIENYQEIHKDEIDERRRQGHEPDEYLGKEPGKTAWSRHVYREEYLELKDGTLLYVRLNEDHSQIEALFPVMIARELYPSSPWNLLDRTIWPASSINELSPADRVFGWVRTERRSPGQKTVEPTAVRGLLRIGPVCCQTPASDAIERFDGQETNGLPLAILAEPKPQQGRFYVAKSPKGEAQDDSLSKQEAGYSPGKGLRGRKVYPHHANLPKDHWQNPLEDRTQEGQAPWQEYRRPRKGDEEQRDKQNRSMLAWVKPGTEFVFDISVLNLSKVELGALLWLLNLPEHHFLRLGGGKPLGFGSVRLTVESSELYEGNALKEKYSSWNPCTNPEDPTQECIEAFKSALIAAYADDKSSRFDEIPFIKAFLRACRGFDDGKPIHYPRATATGQPGSPSPDGESYKWFVANEKRENRYVLHNLWEDPGLPTLKDPSPSRQQRNNRRRR